MSNYFSVSRQCNLILNVIASSDTPLNSTTIVFIEATEKALDVYYKWLEKNPNLCPDIGDIVSRCKYLQDNYHTGKARMVYQNLNRRYRPA